MNYNVWRFPGNNYTFENGLNNADMETFKKDPMASLARETCQNSIDAKREECSKAIIKFESFIINERDIPGVDRLKEEVYSCYDYRKHPKDKAELNNMKVALNKEKIRCLRISDYNTIGLRNVFGTDESSKFYLLTRGSGITDKGENTGGSKGVGKFASFVASAFNTVFYSTKNIAGEEGYLGISKLCSTICKDDPAQKTIGIGYYSSDETNKPISGQFSIQPGYVRNEPGTDIYILGFKGSDDWEKRIITMVLDSFMCAIVFDELEVHVDGVVISKETVGKLVSSEYIMNINQKRNIMAQYSLLTDDGIYSETFNINDLGSIKILLKTYSKLEADIATKQCVMIRYPYMKIRTMRKISSVPCSAMCIIQKGELNKQLINIENPQHTDWETNRLEPALKKEMDFQIETIEETIYNYIADTLSLGQDDQSDIEGASEFLPSTSQGDFGEESKVVVDAPIVIPKTRSKIKVDNPIVESTDGSEGDKPDIGEFDEGDDTEKPSGHNKGKGQDPHETNEKTGHKKEGDKEILHSAPLTGMKYTPFFPNISSGEVVIAFKSLYDASDCELVYEIVDDSNKSYKAEIIEATINDNPAQIEDGKIVKFNLELDTNYVVKAKTNIKEYYRNKVTIYENKK